MATENPPFADDVRIKTSNLYGISQLAMFDCQRVGIRGSLITIVFQAKATLVGTSSPSTLPQPTLLKLRTDWIWDLGSWKHQNQFWWRSKSSPKRTPIFGKNWTSLIFLIIIPTSIPMRSPCFPANKSQVFYGLNFPLLQRQGLQVSSRVWMCNRGFPWEYGNIM